MEKFYTIGFFLVVLLFIESAQFCLCGNSGLGCREGERQALLKFKQSLQDSSQRLSSWGSTDCCKWDGVRCSKSTGHVVKLDLHFTGILSDKLVAADEMDSCLLALRYLNYLDLSDIDFQETPIPKFLGLMGQLRYLNLSGAHFSGMVPPQLGNLTNMRVLDLHDFHENLKSQNIEWISRLLSLQHLDMSGVHLAGASSLMQVLNMLPSLLVLRLSSCWLNNTHLFQANTNSTFLSTLECLDLGKNSFRGPFPLFLRNMTSLRALDLSYNSFDSSIPLWLGNLQSLVHLNFEYSHFNSIEGGLSTFLWNSCYLKSLDLSSNVFYGELSETYKNLSGCIEYDLEALSLSANKISGHLPDRLGHLKKLKHLDLRWNLFDGPIPASLGRFSMLRELDLSNNHLNGTIPETLGKLLALRELNLYNNQLNGAIPKSLGQLSNLRRLDISSNSLAGVLSEVHFANLSRLEELSISHNHLAFEVNSDWLPPFQLKFIQMRSCNIRTLPQWLGTQKEVMELDLSNGSISGPIPKWFEDMRISALDLSHNQISGRFPNLPYIPVVDFSSNLLLGPLPQNIGYMMPTLKELILADNRINGTIPSSLCKIQTLWDLDLSKNDLSGNIPNCWKTLERLDLSNNRLSGNVPNWQRDNEALDVINLSSNKLTGAIPRSIGHLSNLAWLHLNNNSLNGELPLALSNCTNLIILNLGENKLSGNIPKWIGESLSSLHILRLRKNMFNSSIPPQICQLVELQILDLANNNLTGTIPRCFGNLSGMAQKQASNSYEGEWDYENVVVAIKGRELEFTKILRLVVSMDLSNNNLIGIIPRELTNLFGLRGLNLSQNHLIGNIPKNIWNLSLLESLDLSRNQLFGLIPETMSALTSLSHLNLSFNNFSGKIPTGNQLQTLDDPSIYIGNHELCGAPLPKKCPSDEPTQAPTPNGYKGDDEEDESEKVWFYIVVMLGFMTGLWGVFGVLLFKKNWRYAYFRFVDETKDCIVVAVAVKAAKLKKKMGRNRAIE